MESLMDFAPAQAVLLDMRRYYFKKLEDRNLLPFIPSLSYLREMYESSLFVYMNEEANTPVIIKMEEKIITRTLDLSHQLEKIVEDVVQEIKKSGKITNFESKEKFEYNINAYHQQISGLLKNTINKSYDDFFQTMARNYEVEMIIIRISSFFSEEIVSIQFKINDFIEKKIQDKAEIGNKHSNDIKILFDEIRKDITSWFSSWGFSFSPSGIARN